MKQIFITILLSFVITGCSVTDNTSGSVESMSPEEVNAQIESLRKFIIPPKGASKADIDAIFGLSEEFKGSLFNKTSDDIPMHKYQLLSPKQGQDFRAYLYVKYNDYKVEYIGISHYCSIGNLAYYSKGSPEQIKQQKMIDGVNRLVLEDLIEIQKKYENVLNNASWNQ